MVNHIERLVEATENLMVSYRYAYNDGPDIGVRGYNMNHRVEGISYQGCQDDMVIVDGVAWLIAGDIWNTFFNVRERDRRNVSKIPLEHLRVNVRAQALVAGRFVTVDLGTRKITERFALEDGEGVLSLVNNA